MSDIPLPPKKPKSCYFFFQEEYRRKNPSIPGGANQSKQIGAEWQQLSAEEKQRFVEMNTKAKVEYEKKLSEYQKAYPEKLNGLSSGESKSSKPKSLDFPYAKIKALVQADPSISRVDRDAIKLIGKATTMFAQWFSKYCSKNTQSRLGNILQPQDIDAALGSTYKLEFLRAISFQSVTPPMEEATSGDESYQEDEESEDDEPLSEADEFDILKSQKLTKSKVGSKRKNAYSNSIANRHLPKNKKTRVAPPPPIHRGPPTIPKRPVVSLRQFKQHRQSVGTPYFHPKLSPNLGPPSSSQSSRLTVPRGLPSATIPKLSYETTSGGAVVGPQFSGYQPSRNLLPTQNHNWRSPPIRPQTRTRQIPLAPSSDSQLSSPQLSNSHTTSSQPDLLFPPSARRQSTSLSVAPRRQAAPMPVASRSIPLRGRPLSHFQVSKTSPRQQQAYLQQQQLLQQRLMQRRIPPIASRAHMSTGKTAMLPLVSILSPNPPPPPPPRNVFQQNTQIQQYYPNVSQIRGNTAQNNRLAPQPAPQRPSESAPKPTRTVINLS